MDTIWNRIGELDKEHETIILCKDTDMKAYYIISKKNKRKRKKEKKREKKEKGTKITLTCGAYKIPCAAVLHGSCYIIIMIGYGY